MFTLTTTLAEGMPTTPFGWLWFITTLLIPSGLAFLIAKHTARYTAKIEFRKSHTQQRLAFYDTLVNKLHDLRQGLKHAWIKAPWPTEHPNGLVVDPDRLDTIALVSEYLKRILATSDNLLTEEMTEILTTLSSELVAFNSRNLNEQREQAKELAALVSTTLERVKRERQKESR